MTGKDKNPGILEQTSENAEVRTNILIKVAENSLEN